MLTAHPIIKNKYISAILFLVITGIGIVGAIGIVGGDTFVTITAATDPDQPTTDEEFAVDVQLRNAPDGGGVYTIDAVRLYDGSDSTGEELAEVESASALVSGSEQTVRLDEIEINETGVHELHVEAILTSGDEEYVVTYPMTVRVYGPEPLLEVKSERHSEDAWRSINLTVANTLDEPINGVTATIDDSDVTPREPKRVASSIGPNEERTFVFESRLTDTSVRDLSVELTYEDPAGEFRALERTIATEFTAPETTGDVRLTDLNQTATSDGVEIEGNVANVGETGVDGIIVTVADEGDGTSRSGNAETFVGSISPGEATSFELVTDIDTETGTIPLDVTYRVDGIKTTTTTEIAYDGSLSGDAIELTGVSASDTSDGVELTGSAANVDTVDVDSVVVSVADVEGVEPTGPQPDFFVGGIEESEFASFTVTADIDDGVTAVPLEVTYLVNGVEQTTTTEIAYDRTAEQSTGNADRSHILPGLVTVSLIGLVVVAIGHRRFR